ncbi:MAG: hypothetical protein ACKOKE_02590 [Actinomycetota bacterium]
MTRTPRFAIANHRGVPTPRTLGILLAGAAAVSGVVVGRLADASPGGIASAASLLVVFAVGFLDDLAPPGPRGLRGHLRALLEGRMTTGVLKAVVIGACALVSAALLPLGPVATIAGIPLLAGAANLGNALDVRPGRALKVFVPVLLVGLATVPFPDHPALPGVALASLPALRRDLRELDMLGDGGANLLGFAGGLVLVLALPGGLVPIASLAVVALTVLAETVGLSTLIARTPALAWFDRVGRRPEP